MGLRTAPDASNCWQGPLPLRFLRLEVFSCHHTKALKDSGWEDFDGGGDNMSPPRVRKAPPKDLNRDGGEEGHLRVRVRVLSN